MLNLDPPHSKQHRLLSVRVVGTTHLYQWVDLWNWCGAGLSKRWWRCVGVGGHAGVGCSHCRIMQGLLMLLTTTRSVGIISGLMAASTSSSQMSVVDSRVYSEVSNKISRVEEC